MLIDDAEARQTLEHDDIASIVSFLKLHDAPDTAGFIQRRGFDAGFFRLTAQGGQLALDCFGIDAFVIRVRYPGQTTEIIPLIRLYRLHHADQPTIAQGMVNHGDIAGLKNIQRQRAIRQQQDAGKRKYRYRRWQLARFRIKDIVSHRPLSAPIRHHTSARPDAGIISHIVGLA